jgi:hypothetical protein
MESEIRKMKLTIIKGRFSVFILTDKEQSRGEQWGNYIVH